MIKWASGNPPVATIACIGIRSHSPRLFLCQEFPHSAALTTDPRARLLWFGEGRTSALPRHAEREGEDPTRDGIRALGAL